MMISRKPTNTQERRPLFVPPKPRHPRRRSTTSWPPADWRERVPPALVRAFASIGFLAIPSFETRFGALTLPLVCVALSVFAGLAAYLTIRSEAATTWPLNATDSVVILLLVPTLTVASGIEVADLQFGGQAANFVSATTAVLGITAIITIVAIVTSVETPSIASLALLPAPLLVAVVIGGAERFAAGSLPQGLSAAWMIAAVATLSEGLTVPRSRSLVPIAAFAVLAIGSVVLGRSTTAVSITDTNAAIALFATAASGLALLIVPAATARAAMFVTESLSPEPQSRVRKRR